jgi:hypothetical protein
VENDEQERGGAAQSDPDAMTGDPKDDEYDEGGEKGKDKDEASR